MTQLPEEPASGITTSRCELLLVGCGNVLRRDDGVGPVLIRHLWERGVPDGVQIVDGGTAGMDVAFRMRGARRVVIIDAARTGAQPGTIYRVPGPELADLPPLEGLHTHAFRWDHALALANWLEGQRRRDHVSFARPEGQVPGSLEADAYPDDVTVFLIEAECVDAGWELSAAVRHAMEEVIVLIERDFLAGFRRAGAAGPHPGSCA
ncbi:hydrogenase maturation protease [Protofrankia symbiont of Coriaria ruscifolia]|uniref:Hydrogenase maturation protease n=1 Tax=Candidatus Protofrankia californiensis TaxID=1839754 RepID=A0A1C3P165_9ACTN|nr:hydrogenase maturation protease [Protofrankia symbiont of Coriaria ruscifolia]SBW23553.1 hydrogenase maturation protease [Candidatus Protofrankia californiensis]